MEKNLREVYSAGNQFKINIIQELLREHSIECVTLNKKDSSFMQGEILLYVNEADLVNARKIIAAHSL